MVTQRNQDTVKAQAVLRPILLICAAVLLAMGSAQAQAPACLYALDGTAQGAFTVTGSTSISISCSAVVESTASSAFQMSGSETLYVQNNDQVGVVGGWQISGQSKIVNQPTGHTVQPVKITSPGDPLSYLPVPTQGTIVGRSHTSYDMNNKPPGNTLSPGVYCGGLTIGNTNGVTFTMSPGTYVMAGGGFTINSQAVVNGSGVTVYNTSSTGWGCSSSSNYTPITISGQANVTMSGPTSGALANVLFWGDRSGCSTVGSCQDQINGGSFTVFDGAMYFKSDTLLFSGNGSSKGCMMAVADKININGNSSFVANGCVGPIGDVTVSVTPANTTLAANQTQQFSATVTNASSNGVTWSISPAGVGTISASGLYTAPASINTPQTVMVTATSQAEPTVSASVTLTLLPAISVTVSPATAVLYATGNQSFTATVSNTPNQAVTWSASPTGVGSISAAGVYTAPATVGSTQTVTVTATSQANSSATASATVTLALPPAITASVSPSPNAAGWNNGNVTVTFTCIPGTFAVATCSSPVVVSTQGANQVVSGTVTDVNGATATTSATVSLDTTAPTVTASISPAPVDGIDYGSATVTFTCSDTLSGIVTCPSPVTDTTIGAGQIISGTATDKAGNTYSASVTLNIQPIVPPAITTAPLPAANGNGWNNSTVTVSFVCTGGTYPVQTCPSPVIISNEGANQSVCGQAIDTNGNKSTQVCDTVNLDKTPPTITTAVSPAPDAAGWNNSAVTVTYTCTDSLSGVANCPSASTDSTSGANQLITGTVTDKAGNTAAANVTLNIELTLPAITGSISPAPNANGWNNSDVTVSFACTPSLAPITNCPPAQPVTTEGANQIVTGIVTDAAGNQSTAKVTVNLGKTLPKITVTPSPAPNANGWNNTPVTLTYTCTAGTAPIATCPQPQVISTPGAAQNITGTVTDLAGNAATISTTLSIATAPPTIVGVITPTPNSAGWNNSNVTVTWTCTPGTAPIAVCPTPTTVSTEGAAQTVSGTVVDLAGDTANANVTVSLDNTLPTITATVTPAPVAGINYNSATVTFACGDALSGVADCPAPVTVTTVGANQSISGTATDKAGNSATANVVLNIQVPIPPSISYSLSPAPNSNGWNNSDVTVSFACSPGTFSVANCSAPVVVSAEGSAQSICGTATDGMGLSANTCTTVNLDKTAPTITTQVSPAPTSEGWNSSPVTVSFTCSDSLSGIVNCPSPQTVSSNGTAQLITGTATDQAGNTANAQAIVNIDLTPPSILQFTAPSQGSPGQTLSVTLNATDAIEITSVVFQLNGNAVATLNAPPYTPTVTVPASANPGDTLTLTVLVTNIAGVTATASRGIQVVAAGVVTGQVLSDVTGLPLSGASVQVIGGNGQDTSDTTGRYSIPLNNTHVYLGMSASNPPSVAVEREVSLQQNVGTVPVDARLTSIAPATAVDATGGTLAAGQVSVAVPPGTVAGATNFYLTTLSQQGVPELLPLGWSPVAAFDLRSDSVVLGPFNASFASLPSSLTFHLVQYDYNSHAWLMVTPNLTATNGSLTVQIPSVGDFALVLPDAGNSGVSVPPIGQSLSGVTMVALPSDATASGSLNPPSISPSGGTSAATLAVQSSIPLPSGTVIQANVSESYALLSGQKLSSASRVEDIVLYQYTAPTGAAAVAKFPVTASQTFQPEGFASGNVHLDILSGRESVRGQVGGSSAVVATGGDATLTVSSGSLSENTAVAVTPESVDGFLPSSGLLVPLAEYNVDFSGETLTAPAALSVAAGSAQPGDTIFLAQIVRVGGVPYLVVVSAAQVSGSNLTTLAVPGTSGITQGGDYVFYKVTSPTGYVSGTVSASGSPVAALVQTDGLPFVAFAGSSGSYFLPALAGSVAITASVPNTALASSTVVQVNAGQTVIANLALSGQVEAATITPANGAVGVPLTAEIDITTTDPINQSTVTSSSVTLVQNGQGSSTSIPVRFVFSQGGTRLAVFPTSALQASASFTLTANGLASSVGALISVPTITFTTQSITVPTFNTSALVFSMPDQNGNVQISAPANSFPAGSTVLIVDQGNGVVLSLTVANDGSVTGQIPATIDDVLAVTITAPDKSTTTFTISQFVAADGTTAIGPGGGTVTGPGGTGIIIPQGALTKGTTFKLTPLDQTAFPVLPNWQGLNFGSGLRITDPAMPTFKKEAKLVFPVPAGAPSNAFYYVYRRLTDQNGNAYFETIDHAFVQGTGTNAQVVTASPPFCGYHNSYAKFTIQADAPPLPITGESQDFFMVWDATAQQGPAGMASPGLIVGLVQQAVPAVIGVSQATTQPDPNTVTIQLDSNPNAVSIYDSTCATFTIFDPQIGGGSRNVTVSDGTTTLHASTVEVNGAQSDDGLYAIYAGLEDLYRNIGRVTFTFPPATPPPAPPQLTIQLFTLDSQGHRQPASGVLQSGTNLVIAFQSKLTVQSASFGSTQLAIQTPDVSDATDGQPERYLSSARAKGQLPLGNAGTYTITATALDPLSLTRVTATKNVLVVASGGTGNTQTVTCTTAAVPNPPTDGCQTASVVDISPTANASGVSPNVFPQITFNEPVTNITASNVVLGELQPALATAPPGAPLPFIPVPIHLVGIRAPNSIQQGQSAIADPVSPSDVLTSLTIEPTQGLKYQQGYTITLNQGSTGPCFDSSNPKDPVPLPQSMPLTYILDLNQAPLGPLCLQEFPDPKATQYQFTTFGPQDLGGVASQYQVLTRPAIIGNYAYAGEYINESVNGLGIFDITDPASPVDLGAPTIFEGRAIDVAGQTQSPVTGGPIVAVAAGMVGSYPTPGNVWLYDVSNPTKPSRIGAVSVSPSATSGIALRLFLKDQYLYSSTFEQGLQVIDLSTAIPEYQQVYGNLPNGPTQFATAVTTNGSGFAMDSIVNTISLPWTTGGTATMFDLAADDFALSSSGSQTLIAATGQLPFVLADPTLSGSAAVLYPPTSTNQQFATNPVQGLSMTSADGKTTDLLCSGRALALASLPYTDASGISSTKHVAVVVGNAVIGSAPPAPAPSCPSATNNVSVVSALMVIDLSQAYTPNSPFTPQAIGFVQLTAPGTDVSVNGTTALVSTGGNVKLVNLANPYQPTLAGQINGNFGSWLAVNSSGVVVGSSTGTGSGVQTSSLGVVPSISVGPSELLADNTGRSAQDLTINYAINGDLSQVSSAQIQITDENNQLIYSAPVPVKSTGQIVWPEGQQIVATPNEITFRVQNPDGGVSTPLAAQAEISTGSQPTPVLSSISPSRVVVGSTGITLQITGRNFLPGSIVVLTQVGTKNVSTYNPQFLGTTSLRAKLPDNMMQEMNSWTVEVLNGTSNSNELTFRVVPTGLPPAPVLNTIAPTQLASTTNPIDTWITLTGSNFVNGDTLVKSDSYPDVLDTQFVSSTQMQALVPAGWLAGPTEVQIHLESASDSDLASQSLVLDVLNTVGATVYPAGPEAISINDGFVSLPDSSATQPTTVTISGNGFQAGAQVSASVDGIDQALPTVFVSPSIVQATVPKPLWSQKNLNVSLNVALTASSTTPNPKASAKIAKTKLTFSAAKNQGFCGGFFREHVGTVSATNPESLFLMVPVVGYDNANATTKGNDALQQKLVSLSIVDPTMASVTPTVLAKKVEPLTVSGQGVYSPSGPTVPMNGLLKFNNSQKTLATLNLQTMPQRTFAVVVHFVSELNGTNSPSSMPKPNKLNQFLQNLKTALNDIWGPQANVQFVVTDPGTLPEPIHYDLNGDGGLQMEGNGQFPPTTGETYQIINATVPNRNANNNPFDASGKETIVHVYFVKKFDPAHPKVGGFVNKIGSRYVFVHDGFSGAYQVHIVAHEIGHALGLHHNDELNATPVNGGENLSDNDSYLAEPNALMNGSTNDQVGPHQCQIGYPHWLQLNQANPNLP